MENQEVWKDVVGFEGYYQVSNLGNVKSFNKKALLVGNDGYILKACNSSKGYKFISLSAKTAYIHRLVCIAFLPNPLNKPQVNHINGIRTDNRVENLEWCTSKENIIHAVKTGLSKFKCGVNHSRCKLTNEHVFKIRKLAAQGISSCKIAKEIGIVSPKQIRNIINRKKWTHI